MNPKRIAATGLALVAVLAVAGCGGGSDGGSDRGAAESSTTTRDDRDVDPKRVYGFTEFESFSGDDSLLPTYDDGRSFGRIESDAFHMGVVAAETSTNASYGVEALGPRVEIEAVVANVGAATDAGFGVACRMQGDGKNYYRFGVGQDGTYAIAKVVDDNATVLTGDGQWVRSDDLEEGLDEYDVKATCIGPRLRLVVNDAPIAEVRDTTFRDGAAGVFVKSFAEPAAEAAFANLTLTQLPEPSSAFTGSSIRAWRDFFAGTPPEVRRCDLLDPTTGLHPDAIFRTVCDGVGYDRLRTNDEVDRAVDALLRRTGKDLTEVDGFPDCTQRSNLVGTFNAPGADPGTIACFDEPGEVVLIFADHDRRVVGIARIRPDDPDFTENFGPTWWPLVSADAQG